MYSKDISQEELAEKIGVSQKTISRYIRGDSKPDGYMIHKIARALDVSLDELNYRERS
jgi:transcriptional regulator with XRE-family HTH domain